MTGPNIFHGAGTYLALNLEPRPEDAAVQGGKAPAITIARQAGARGVTICTLLHQKLEERDAKEPPPWKLFDSELSKEILKTHGLPTHLEKFIPDNAVGELEAMTNEILGRHPSLWKLYEDSVETISNLARTGHCILVGRGGNHITRKLTNVLNVRLIGSHWHRQRNIQKNMQLSESEAEALLRREDKARRSYVKQHYHVDIDDPEHYDLVINTDYLSDEVVVATIMRALPTR